MNNIRQLSKDDLTRKNQKSTIDESLRKQLELTYAHLCLFSWINRFIKNDKLSFDTLTVDRRCLSLYFDNFELFLYVSNSIYSKKKYHLDKVSSKSMRICLYDIFKSSHFSLSRSPIFFVWSYYRMLLLSFWWQLDLDSSHINIITTYCRICCW